MNFQSYRAAPSSLCQNNICIINKYLCQAKPEPCVMTVWSADTVWVCETKKCSIKFLSAESVENCGEETRSFACTCPISARKPWVGMASSWCWLYESQSQAAQPGVAHFLVVQNNLFCVMTHCYPFPQAKTPIWEKMKSLCYMKMYPSILGHTVLSTHLALVPLVLYTRTKLFKFNSNL